MSFDKILGHKRAVNLLEQQLKENSLSQSYMFSGPRGVGKLMTAFEFAKAVQCAGSTPGACDECAACKKVASGNHPDIFFIEASEGTIGVDTFRECQKWLSLKPFEGKKKVVLVENMDGATQQAANCFLKTLEEPPGESLVVMCSVNIHSLLPTILSRCQVIRFLPLPLKVVSEMLEKRYPENRKQGKVIASLSRGCPGRGIHYFERNILAERDFALDLLAHSLNGNIEYVLSQGKTIGTDKERFINIINLLSLIMRDLAVIRTDSAAFVINSDILNTLFSLSKQVSVQSALTLFEQTEKARREVFLNLNRQLIAESLFLKVQENVRCKRRG